MARRSQSQEEMLARLYTVVHDGVQDAVDNLETPPPSGTAQKVARYLYRAAASNPGDLLELPWEQCCKSYIDHAMQAYSGQADKDFYFELELGDVFGKACMELLSASRHPHAPRSQQVRDFANRQFDQWLDEALHERAMWLAVNDTFEDDKAKDKVFNSLKRTYKAAVDAAEQGQRHDDLARLKTFLSRWLEDSLGRAWSSLGADGDRILNEDSATRLFERLLAPFGEQHPFSCIPTHLTEGIGRPPVRWSWVPHQVRVTFRRWRSPAFGGASKKRRKKGGGGGEETWGVEMEAESLPPPRSNTRSAPRVSAEHPQDDPADEEEMDQPGHPDCTSQEDCVGSEADELMRHMHDGKEGDTYCMSCWKNFLSMNPKLEGFVLPRR